MVTQAFWVPRNIATGPSTSLFVVRQNSLLLLCVERMKDVSIRTDQIMAALTPGRPAAVIPGQHRGNTAARMSRFVLPNPTKHPVYPESCLSASSRQSFRDALWDDAFRRFMCDEDRLRERIAALQCYERNHIHVQQLTCTALLEAQQLDELSVMSPPPAATGVVVAQGDVHEASEQAVVMPQPLPKCCCPREEESVARDALQRRCRASCASLLLEFAACRHNVQSRETLFEGKVHQLHVLHRRGLYATSDAESTSFRSIVAFFNHTLSTFSPFWATRLTKKANGEGTGANVEVGAQVVHPSIAAASNPESFLTSSCSPPSVSEPRRAGPPPSHRRPPTTATAYDLRAGRMDWEREKQAEANRRAWVASLTDFAQDEESSRSALEGDGVLAELLLEFEMRVACNVSREAVRRGSCFVFILHGS